MKQEAKGKSIAFLMELIFVIFFFTIASAICVQVLDAARTKSMRAQHTRDALVIAENLVEQRQKKDIRALLKQNSFYLDAKGNLVKQKGTYKAVIQHGDILEDKQRCELQIFDDQEKLVSLPFLLGVEK